MRLGTTSLSVTKPGPRRRRFLGIYTLSSASSVNEGDNLTVNVNTVGVPSGTVLYWQTSNITTSDSDFTATSGSVQIINGAGNFTIAAVADSTTEGAETFGITLRRISPSGPIVASTTNKTINDTSLSSSYSASSPSSVNEGSALVCTVTTTNVADSTTLYWTTSHTSTTDADFSYNSGSFTITSNSGTFNVTPTADATTEGAETFTVQIRTGSVSGTIVATLPSITVNDTSLTPSGWDINNATYNQVSTSTLTSSGHGFTFAGNGTKVYVVTSNYQNTQIWQYSLATAWDISSTISYERQLNLGQDHGQSVKWKPDGTRFYLIDRDEDYLKQFNVSTAWDINGASLAGNQDLTAYEGQTRDVAFSSDGTKVFVTGSGLDKVDSFTLSTAWDVTSTFTHVASSSTLPFNAQTMDMRPDGTSFYFCLSTYIYQFDPTTAFDVSTLPSSATYTLDNSSRHSLGHLQAAYIKPDGSKLFTYNNDNGKIYQYDL